MHKSDLWGAPTTTTDYSLNSLVCYSRHASHYLFPSPDRPTHYFLRTNSFTFYLYSDISPAWNDLHLIESIQETIQCHLLFRAGLPHPLHVNSSLLGHLLLFSIYSYTIWQMYCPLFFFNLFYLFIYFWLHWVFVAEPGLFSSCGEQGLLFVVVCRLLIAVASLVAEHRL